MKTALLRMETAGMKGIKDWVSLDFYSKKTLSNFKLDDDNVRVLYGPNGVGKSSIMLSAYFIKQIVGNPSFIASLTRDSYTKLINKERGRFDVVFYFASNDEKANKWLGFRYSLTLNMDESSPYIQKEKLERLVGVRWMDNYQTVLENENGNLLSFLAEKGEDMISNFKEYSKNVSREKSILTLFSSFFVKNNKRYVDYFVEEERSKDAFAIVSAIRFFRNLNVYVNPSDLPKIRPDEKDIDSFLKSITREEFLSAARDISLGDEDYDFVPIKEKENYMEMIKRMKTFLQIFKSNIKDIRIDETIQRDKIRCRKIFVYPNYEVDYEFESTGIKNLSKMFSLLDFAADGGTVFIDEFDANISGVYLRKLVEYMNSYGKGQLFFTAHSLDPMVSLSDKRKALFFLGVDNKVTTWTKNGHYKPYNLYPEGMIEGAPFNIESFDFLKCFSSRED